MAATISSQPPMQQSIPPQTGPGGGPPPGGYYLPSTDKGVSRTNPLGIIVLVTSVIGFIFCCIPGAFIIGWILIPIALILGIVSLFLKDKSKWMGVSAVVISIVGTVVGFSVFFFALAGSLEDSFSKSDVSVNQSTEGSGSSGGSSDGDSAGGSGEPGTRGNPHPLGAELESDDWRVVVNSVDFQATEKILAENEFNDPPESGNEYIMVNYSATYIGDDPDGSHAWMIGIDYVTPENTTVTSYDSSVVIPDSIHESNALYTNGVATGNIVFEVPSDSARDGVLAVQPDFLGDKVFVALE